MTEAVRRLGKYEIIEEIGKGGFATVYRARDLDLGREVALKVLDPLLTRDPVWVARFRREARAAATLDHPRIVTVHEIGQSEGALFIAMKLVEGGSLAQRLAGGGSLPWDEAVRVVSQVAEALDYAHGQGVLHRDLKPANVLLDPRTGAVLTDFGFARLLADNSLSVSMSGGIVGTPATMAPEVWEGQEPTAQADVYALGCILYELVTGRPLFSGATPPAVMLAHFKPLLLPDAWPQGTPPGLGEVLQTALARDPAARYARAGDLAAAVAALSVDRLAEPYAALQAAAAGQQWPEALALAGEIKAGQPDYRDVAALERQALAGLEGAARAQSAAQWRATAEEALAAGDLAAAQLALKQWQSVMPEDPALASAQARLQVQQEAVQRAEEREREFEVVVQETTIEQLSMATPPPPAGVPPVAVASAERPPSRGRSAWALLAVGALAVIVVLALALRGGGEQPGKSVAFVETPAAASATLLSTDTPTVPTSTPVPPTNTPVPPTDTPEGPIDTPVPPTDTPAPPTATPSSTPTKTSTPRPTVAPAQGVSSLSDAVVRAVAVNLRNGPDTVFHKIAIYYRDTAVDIIGKDESGEWIQVRTPDAKTGWVMTDMLTMNRTIDQIQVVESPALMTISGVVKDTLGRPIEGVGIYITSQLQGYRSARVETRTDREGYFQADVPPSEEPVWNVSASNSCRSDRMLGTCSNNGFYVSNNPVTIRVPQSQPISFLFQVATTVIRGNAPPNYGVVAQRSDGVRSWGTVSNTGQFEIPASDGTWEVYAWSHQNPYTESERVRLVISDGSPSPPITLTAP